MAWAYDTCARWGATLTVIHVWEYPYAAMRTGALPIRDYIVQDAAEELGSSVDRLKATKGEAVTVRSKLVGGPTRIVLRRADADLLVLGSVTASIVEHPTLPSRSHSCTLREGRTMTPNQRSHVTLTRQGRLQPTCNPN